MSLLIAVFKNLVMSGGGSVTAAPTGNLILWEDGQIMLWEDGTEIAWEN